MNVSDYSLGLWPEPGLPGVCECSVQELLVTEIFKIEIIFFPIYNPLYLIFTVYNSNFEELLIYCLLAFC